MILKVLLVVAVVATVYFLFIKKKPQAHAKEGTKNRPKNSESDDMVECSNCGVYASLNESILSGSHYYCSKECLKEAK